MSHFVFESKNIVQVPIESSRPQLTFGRTVVESYCDPYLIPRSRDRAFEQRVHL